MKVDSIFSKLPLLTEIKEGMDAKKERRYRRHIKRYKRMICRKVAQSLDYRVSYGPFSGMSLPHRSYWGDDAACMVLGVYEKEVQDALVIIQNQRRRKLLINLGGGDGYYAIGSLVNNLFDRCIVFEVVDKGREQIALTAKINGICSERLTIMEEANKATLMEVVAHLANDGMPMDDIVLLSDVEGAEFEIFDLEVLETMSKIHMIIEIHEFIDPGKGRQRLLKNVSNYFEIEKLRTGGRDLSSYKEVEHLPDIDRALLISEGRPCLMEWWHLIPRGFNS